MKELTTKELNLLNSKDGLRFMLAEEGKINYDKVLQQLNYEEQLKKLQLDLIKLQTWVIENKKKIVVIFEGRDAAGKGGTIRRITSHLNPRHFKVVALPKPTEDEEGQWYFQRYVEKLPKAGQIIFFDRSWYNRAIVEPVMGFCSKKQYTVFMSQVNEFERMITEDGITLIKFYLSINRNEQEKRFQEIKENPLKKWKFSSVDAKSLDLWDDYTEYKELMFNKASTFPWTIIDANKKSNARLKTMQYLLDSVAYDKNIAINKLIEGLKF